LEFVDTVKTFWRKGGGLFIFEDNDTIDNSLSNQVLNATLGFTLHGNDPGSKILEPGMNKQKQSFNKEHAIFTGVLKIHEGETLAYPKCEKLPPKVEVIARSSTNKPCIMCYDDLKNGRVVVDTDYTKLYKEYYT
jgi:hypothetical protein